MSNQRPCIVVSGSRHQLSRDEIAWRMKHAQTNAGMLAINRMGSICEFNESRMRDVISAYRNPITQIATGDAKGVDEFVRDNFNDPLVFSAAWRDLGKKAGPHRNGEMLRFAKGEHSKVLLVAFPMLGRANTGTLNCIKQALAMEIETIVVWLDNVL